MTRAIITITRGGLALARKIREGFPDADIYALPKWAGDDCIIIEGGVAACAAEIFGRYNVIIFVSAVGIAVRCIGPLVRSKTADPAVLVIDEAGRFVISVLSGHIGGGNAAANDIARLIGAIPVITTASDAGEKLSVDMLAGTLGCVISDLEQAKRITAMIVNDEPVAMVSDIPVERPDCVLSDPERASGIIYITHNILSDIDKPYAQLIPRNVVAGMGCRKGVPAADVIAAVEHAFQKCRIDRRALKCIATITLKIEEPGFIGAARHFNVPIVPVSIEEVRDVEHEFAASVFVSDAVGVGAVCEPCGFIASGRTGRMLMGKEVMGGITISLWEGDQ